MSVKPIKYPVKVSTPPNNSANKQESFYLDSRGVKVKKYVAFGEYEKEINIAYSQVKRHEDAHNREAGPQAIGVPEILYRTDRDGRKIAYNGRQKVKIPKPVNEKDPLALIKKTITAANYTAKGSFAPASFDTLSAPDIKNGARSLNILADAEKAKAIVTKKQQIQTEKQKSIGQKLNLIG